MKNSIYSIFGLGAAVLLSGCSDFLDPRNSSSPEDSETYFAAHSDQLRPVAYDAVRYLATQVDMLDQAADLFINPRGADDGRWSMFTVTPDDSKVSDYYKKVMDAVNKANAMIYFGEKAGNDKLVAEGKFLRVFNYYYLVQQFGAVPYSDQYIQSSTRDYPRMGLAELYPILIETCQDLYNNSVLPEQDHKGYASKQAVAAIAAKIELAAGWDLDVTQTDYAKGLYSAPASKAHFQNAAAWAEKAINGVQLTMPFAEKWAYNNEGNEEEIFSIQWDRDGYPGDKASGGNSLMYDYTAYWGNVMQSGMKGTGGGGTNVMSKKAASLFEKGDQRFEGTFMTTFYNPPRPNKGNAEWGTEGYLAFYNCSAEELAKKPIAYKIYAPETTVAEAEADIKLMVASGQAKKFAENEYGVNIPYAAIITGTTVTIWNFNAAGTMPSNTTMDYDTYCKQASGNGTCVRKYDDPTSGQVTGGQCYRDIPMLHVSEMYLTAAEAYYMAGDEPKALAKINAVRKRAGVKELSSFSAYQAPYVTTTNFTVNALDLILDERARETYAERTRFFDLRRTKQLFRYNLEFSRFMTKMSDMCNAAGVPKEYRPIPQAELDANTATEPQDGKTAIQGGGMYQNPGY